VVLYTLTLEESADMNLILFRIYKHRPPSSSRPMLSIFTLGGGGVLGERWGEQTKIKFLAAVLLKYFHRRLHSKRPMDVYGRDAPRAATCVYVCAAISHISIFRAHARAMECSLLPHNHACARWKNARWETEDEMWQCGKCLAFPLLKFIYLLFFFFS